MLVITKDSVFIVTVMYKLNLLHLDLNYLLMNWTMEMSFCNTPIAFL